MAGSDNVRRVCPDPIVAASLEAVRWLAELLTEPATVIDRGFEIVYANPPASAGMAATKGGTLSRERGGRCYEVFYRRDEPCSFCPAGQVFETGAPVLARPNLAQGDGGLVQAVPLLAADGTTAFMLEIVRGDGEKRCGEAEARYIDDLIGRSQAMRQLVEMIRLVADSQATILLQGESGTGKELVAKTIHRLSRRKDQPFVVVDCGSLPETLLESELFGHVKGAFTGAMAAKKGLFEEAHGGTVLLDEIADTSFHFQSKLLRVLQEGEIKPVGSSRSVTVDVRVISATNRDLLERVKAKAFREDLYYRLAVLPLDLPPLRERRADIPLLVQHFVNRACRRHRKPPGTVTPDAMQALQDRSWPGNIRELEHMVERVVVTATGPQLTREDFFGQAKPLGLVGATDLRTVTRSAVEAAERTRILEALRQAAGKKASAARALKISRASLYNKLRAYRIE